MSEKATELSTLEANFSRLEELEGRFLDNERAYDAEYKKGTDGEDNRTSKRKASNRSRSKLYIPLTKTTINIIHSIFKTSFMSKRCPIEVNRIGQMSQDDQIKRNAITAALKHEWKNKGHRVGLSLAVLEAIVQPMGTVALFYDKSRKEIRTRHVPIMDIAFDEHATDILDTENKAYKWKQSVREVKDLISKGVYTPKKRESHLLFPQGAPNSTRLEMSDFYERVNLHGKPKWKRTTFCGGVRVQVRYIKRTVFHSGYCLEKLPRVNADRRAEELQMYGSCVPELVREIQTEYNKKRNQKIDITENAIDPLMAIDKDAGAISINDINQRKKYIRVQTGQGKRISDVITTLGEPGTYGLTEEIAMLKGEYEVASGINPILTGQTSPSDRRAMGALQTVNASSSMRIESMMQTLQDTMLNGYAEHFVDLVWQYTPDEVFIRLTEREDIIDIIGTQGNRVPLDFDVEVNFGTTIANEAKLQQLNSLLQILMQAGQGSPELLEDILKEILVLIKGETADTQSIKTTQEEEAHEPTLEEKEAAAISAGGV